MNNLAPAKLKSPANKSAGLFSFRTVASLFTLVTFFADYQAI